MADIVPLPPDPGVDIDPAQSPAEVDGSRSPRRKWRRARQGAESNQHKPRSKAGYDIPVPTPQNLDRPIPAGDTDEAGTRSKWWRTEDTHHAEIAKLQAQNAAKNLTDPLSALVSAERKLQRELRLRKQAASVAQQARDQLAAQLHDNSGSEVGPRSRRLAIRRHLARASSVSSELERREIDTEYKLGLVTHRINLTADLVAEEVAIVLGHFWREYEERWLARSHEVGIWRDVDELRGWGQRSFDELVGAPAVPSSDGIRERIRVLRGGLSSLEAHDNTEDVLAPEKDEVES